MTETFTHDPSRPVFWVCLAAFVGAVGGLAAKGIL